ncbi:unnamed protein product [Schistosoma turkestanicum]|nr:unnamed protein product [Schistosoma turkestanicum]
MNTPSLDSKSTENFSQDISNQDFKKMSPSNDSGLITDVSVCDTTSQCNRNSPNPCQSDNEVDILNESIHLQQTKHSDKLTNTTDNIISHSMGDFNEDKKNVTISEPSDKLSQDIQLKAEQILTDLRSVPLNYPVKRKRKTDVNSLSITSLKNKQGEDEIGDLDENDVTVPISDGGDDDSNDEYKELSDKIFPRILPDKNQSHYYGEIKLPNKTVYKNFENIHQKSKLLKTRCEMLQTYINFLEARKLSLEHSITELNQHFERTKQQLHSRMKENESKFDLQQFEEILSNQSIALAKEKEQSTQLRLKYESVEAARFELSQQLQLISSEYDADKKFYQKQIKQLEQEIQERINKANQIKSANEQLQNEIIDFQSQINSLKEQLKQKEVEVNAVSQCYDQKMKEENEQHDLDIVKLQREITDLSVRTSKASTKYEYEIETLNIHLRISQNKIHDLLCEKEYLCKELQDVTHKLNINSQEKEELQKKMDDELLKIKQEKDIEKLKTNHEVEIENLKTKLKETETLKEQLMRYIDTLENCIYNPTQQKQFCNQQIQTDVQSKPVELYEESKKSNDLKNTIASEPKLPSPPIYSSSNMNDNKPKLNYLTSVNKSTETVQLDSIMNQTNVPLMKHKDYQQLIDNYENKLSHLHLCLHQLYQDYNSLIRLFNSTIYGIIKFANRECNRFSKLLNISNHEIEIPSTLLLSKFYYPLKLLKGNEKISNLTENTSTIKSCINPLIDVIGKLSAYCTRICDLIESQQEYLEWQSENVNELRNITRKQIEIQNKQLLKTRKANLNRLKNYLKQKQHNPSLNELNRILSKDNPYSYCFVYSDGSNIDKFILPINDIESKANYNMSILKNSMYPQKSIDSHTQINDSINKPPGLQHRISSPVSAMKGLFDKSPPLRLLHENSTISPYENIKCPNVSENSYNQDGQFHSPNLL